MTGSIICKMEGEIQVIAGRARIQPVNPSSQHEGSLVIHTCDAKARLGFTTSKLITTLCHSPFPTTLYSLSIVLYMKLAEKNLTSLSVPRLTHSSFQMRNGQMLRVLLIF